MSPLFVSVNRMSPTQANKELPLLVRNEPAVDREVWMSAEMSKIITHMLEQVGVLFLLYYSCLKLNEQDDKNYIQRPLLYVIISNCYNIRLTDIKQNHIRVDILFVYLFVSNVILVSSMRSFYLGLISANTMWKKEWTFCQFKCQVAKLLETHEGCSPTCLNTFLVITLFMPK